MSNNCAHYYCIGDEFIFLARNYSSSKSNHLDTKSYISNEFHLRMFLTLDGVGFRKAKRKISGWALPRSHWSRRALIRRYGCFL